LRRIIWHLQGAGDRRSAKFLCRRHELTAMFRMSIQLLCFMRGMGGRLFGYSRTIRHSPNAIQVRAEMNGSGGNLPP
jgi:hypothetical protein